VTVGLHDLRGLFQPMIPWFYAQALAVFPPIPNKIKHVCDVKSETPWTSWIRICGYSLFGSMWC